MAFHDIATSFWSRAAAARGPAIPPRAECVAASHVLASDRDEGAPAREPDWEGQWQVLKYF